MNDKRIHDENALIAKTCNDFFEGARIIETQDMTALSALLVETLVVTMATHTDADTALYQLSLIIMRLAPKCSRGSVHVMGKPPETVQ